MLYTVTIHQYYVGNTVDFEDRLPRHNLGKSLSIKKRCVFGVENIHFL